MTKDPASVYEIPMCGVLDPHEPHAIVLPGGIDATCAGIGESVSSNPTPRIGTGSPDSDVSAGDYVRKLYALLDDAATLLDTPERGRDHLWKHHVQGWRDRYQGTTKVTPADTHSPGVSVSACVALVQELAKLNDPHGYPGIAASIFAPFVKKARAAVGADVPAGSATAGQKEEGN